MSNSSGVQGETPDLLPIPEIVQAIGNGTLSLEMVKAWVRHPYVSVSALQRTLYEFIFAQHQEAVETLRKELAGWVATASELSDENNESFNQINVQFREIQALKAQLQAVTEEHAKLKAALTAIVALDFKKTDRGRDDFYSGAPRFVAAWTLAHDALQSAPHSVDDGCACADCAVASDQRDKQEFGRTFGLGQAFVSRVTSSSDGPEVSVIGADASVTIPEPKEDGFNPFEFDALNADEEP